MLFQNAILLFGLAAVAIPIIIHLLNRQTNRVVEWGAMNFLLESLAIRNRRIQLEEALLMACRCLLVGLLALALCRPFIPPTSNIPWLLVLPLAFIGIIGLGVATVLQNEPQWRKWILIVSIAALLICAALVVFEKYLNLSRFGPGGRQDIALIIDGSTSMTMIPDSNELGVSNFERAIEEARAVIKRAPRGDAFSLILGGPTPNAKVLEPTTDRAELEAILDEIQPLDGPMATYNAFTLAALSLTRGDHTAKQIILISDGQSVGWETGKADRWNFLRDAFKNLPVEPQIVFRELALPSSLRNLAVTDVSLSREIVGVDRPVEVSVTIENTGDEAVTPSSVDLLIGDLQVETAVAGTIQPGAKETLNFTHQFTSPGATVLTARIAVGDEIIQDNERPVALNVADSLRVLLVDGRTSGRFFERAATFPALALAPSSLTLYPEKAGTQSATTDELSYDDNAASYDPNYDPVRFLVEPTIVPTSELTTLLNFSAYDTVILADVPQLTSGTADRLVQYVQAGGGLLIAPGSKASPEFYNNWPLSDGTFLPATLGETLSINSGDNALSPSAQSLIHPALQKIAARKGSDFDSANIQSHWPLTVPDALSGDSSVGARLTDGSPMLVSRRIGQGTVVLLATTLDNQSGNLPTRQSYLPFLHELTYSLANPAAYDLNLEPGWEVALQLSGTRGSVLGQGLRAAYYSPIDAQEEMLTRVDPSIQFDWKSGSPANEINGDSFRVTWQGAFSVPKTGNYKFEGDVDDDLEVFIDGKRVLTASYGKRGKSGNEKYEANRWYDFKAVLKENSGDAKAILFYESKNGKVPKQVIPPTAFRTFSPASESKEGDSAKTLASLAVIGPDGKPREAQLDSTAGGSLVKIRGDISAGKYSLEIPEDQRPYFRHFLGEAGSVIPFTVKRDAAESYLNELTEADYAFLKNFVALVQPDSLENMLSIVAGNEFGRELWKYLVLGAFLFLLVEIALSRWIARNRRSGEEIQVNFASKSAPTSGFQKQLAKMGKT